MPIHRNIKNQKRTNIYQKEPLEYIQGGNQQKKKLGRRTRIAWQTEKKATGRKSNLRGKLNTISKDKKTCRSGKNYRICSETLLNSQINILRILIANYKSNLVCLR